MKSPQSLSLFASKTVEGSDMSPICGILQGFSCNEPLWMAVWGDRSHSGTLTDCLDFMGIYGSARNFHMREASRTGRTGGDLWRVQLLREQLAS